MTKSLTIIIASTRKQRIGPSVAQWVEHVATEHEFTVDTIDLETVDLPMFDAPLSPMRAPVDTPEAKAWAAQIDKTDRIIIVTPEYNRSIPAPLKNAIDYLHGEWNNKPAAIVSYGYMDGGTSVTKHLQDVLGFLKVDLAAGNLAISLTEKNVIDNVFSHENVGEEVTTQLVTILDALA